MKKKLKLKLNNNFFFLIIFSNYEKYLDEFDIAPLISILTGLPIPSSSYGTIDLKFLSDFSLNEKIYVFFYNTQKLFHDLLNVEATKYINCEY